MNADQVRALVAAKWPQAINSPLAKACVAFEVRDQACRAVAFAQLQADATCANSRQLRADAMEHAQACLSACDGWTVETLGHNIESVFGLDLDPDDCDAIARKALGELDTYDCDDCCGKGWNWEARQVAERATDVQDFKIDCEACQGRGYLGPDAEAREALHANLKATP